MSLVDDISKGSLVALDTAIWIYELEDNPVFCPLTNELFLRGFAAGHCRASCSLLVLGELLVQPLSLARLDVADRYRRIIAPSPQLAVWAVSREVIEIAAVLRAEYRIRMLDAIRVASAVVNGADRFLTNDEGLRRIREIPILVLVDYVSPAR
jgi:predicted nucleic acid-binding protein